MPCETEINIELNDGGIITEHYERIIDCDRRYTEITNQLFNAMQML